MRQPVWLRFREEVGAIRVGSSSPDRNASNAHAEL